MKRTIRSQCQSMRVNKANADAWQTMKSVLAAATWILTTSLWSAPAALAAEIGNPAACSDDLPAIALGQSVSGTLNAETDCFQNDRLSDRYLLNLDQTTLFRVHQTNEAFSPMTGIYQAGDDTRLLGSRINTNDVYTEYLLPAGQYWLFASSWQADPDVPPSGDYSLNLSVSLALSDVQADPLYGPTRLLPQGNIQGSLSVTDSRDTIGATLEQNRYLDGYSFAVPAGETLTVSVVAGYPLLFAKWQGSSFSDLTFAEARTGGASEEISFQLAGPGNYLMYPIGGVDDATGPYTLMFSTEVESESLSFSHTFSSYRNVIDEVVETGASDHVLSGVLDVVRLDSDRFAVTGIRQASLDGNTFAVGNTPGIVAVRPNQPATVSLSGDLLDMLICPNGFTDGNDCPFGAEGGFLVSDAWPLTGSTAGDGAALAGHPDLGVSYRDRDIPINKSNWSAELVTQTVQQHDVLVSLYHATGGVNWSNNAGWLGGIGTQCNWHGVQCDGNNQVTHLQLEQNNLVGSVPAELGTLASLQRIFMGGNQLSGTVPDSLGNLENLTGIWLWGNQFSGALPAFFGEMTQLNHLALGGNQFTGAVPSSYGNLVNLLDLNLAYNQLSGTIPASLANLVNADWIDLSNNQLDGDVPQSVLDLGVVNLWANPELTNIAFGNPAACENQTALALDTSVNGELTPFQDCYFDDEEGRLMADFYRLDLSAATDTTLIQVEAYSDHYYPHVGVLDADGPDGLDIVDTQIQQNGLSFELALPPGEYVLYIHGGSYQPQNVAATGAYTLGAEVINELQIGCQAFNSTWVTKGIEIDAVLSSDDCLDDFNEPSRLFDSYAIWLEQGEAVTVTLEADIATQLLSFNQSSFIAGTPATAANTKHGLTVTATSSGWHRFAPYTTNNNPTETGAYTIRFLEPIVVGDSQSCTQNLPGLALAGTVNGALVADSDCFVAGRLQDRYVLDITEPTLLQATIETDGYLPMLGVYRAFGDALSLAGRVGINNSVVLELYLAPGQYWLYASSRFPALDQAIEGNYTLNLSQTLPLGQIQTGGCVAGDARIVISGSTTITGQVGAGDCTDQSNFGNQTGNPELDGYQFVLPADTAPLLVSVNPDFNTRLAVWRNGVVVNATTAGAGQSTSQMLTQGGTYSIYVLGQQGPNGGTADRGNYTLDLDFNAGGEILPIAFSYSFSGSSSSGQTGVSDHVLEGIVDAVMVDDDIFEVVGIREGSLDGNVYTIGENPGITATRSNQPALMSLSGDLFDVLICPSGFTQGTDCPFGSEGGFLISDFWPSTGSLAGQTGALAGHPNLGASYRDRDIPLIRSSWNAAVVTASQRDILIALYNATGGGSWTNNDGWLGESGTECSWYGVSCENNEVFYIDLRNNNLTGTLPAALGSLSTLRSFDIGNNQVGGELPVTLANLSNLTGFWAYNNQLSGAIPSALGNISTLRHLNLDGNNLSGSIPSSLGNLSNLTELALSYNLLTGQIPSELGNLGSLTRFDLRNNQLSGDVPQSVLDLGVVNLWGNINLNLAKGDAQACVAGASLNVGETAHGSLTPFSDCYVADENVMVDFYTLDLSDAQGSTLIRVSGDSQAFWPHMGIIGAEGLGDQDVVETQVGEPLFSFEAALAPGEYTLYIHGGAYNHDKNVDVPATGDYSLSVSAIAELQIGCGDFNNTWVTKGTQVDAALSSDDCLDDFNEPSRLFDSYAIWLEQGEAVTVTLDSEIATQLLSFNETGYISASSGPANTRHGVTVTAQNTGWHRFAPYTTNDNPSETGVYTVRFLEPILVGNPQVCSDTPPAINIGGSAQGVLDAQSDCGGTGRLSDRYTLDIVERTLVRVDLQTDGFMPLVGLYRAEAPAVLVAVRVGINNTTMMEMYLDPGQYQLLASSRFPALDEAIEGTYTLSVGESLPVSQIQTGGCAVGDTRLVLDGPLTIQGEVTDQDCFDGSQFGDQDGNPERDSYQMVIPAGGDPVHVNLSADFNARLAIWRNGVLLDAIAIDSGERVGYSMTDAGSYQINVLGQQGPNVGTADRGSYSLNVVPIGADGTAVSVAFSYEFDANYSGNPGDVLTGIIEGLLYEDGDTIRVTDVRSASLAGNDYTFTETIGIRAANVASKPLISLSGNVLDVWVCPAGFVDNDDCSFGNQGGFLASYGSTPVGAAAHAGIPALGASFRDSDRPINQANWSASLIAEPLSQHDILLAIYNATGGDSWTNNNGWLGELGTECSWHGVQCNGQNQVTGLNLAENNLSGTLPDSVGQLNQLTNLSLYRNQIGGAIPTTLGQLSQLSGLGLFENNFSGTIPSTLGQLVNLTYIDLGSNELTGSIPVSLGNMVNLERLYLYNNMLSGSIPVELGQLGNLTVLQLSNNELTGQIPQSILDLTLSELSLSGNSFSISSQQRATLVSLYNATNGESWTNNTGWLGESGTECDWFGVQCFDGEVTQINLGGNNLIGALPAEVGNLNSLHSLSLWGNELSGAIPLELGSLSNLTYLDLNRNLLSGQIPASLANLINLETLDLRNNLLSGDVPQSVLDLGVVRLWANINLNLPKGDAAACTANVPIIVGGSVNGELTPFTDCYIADENVMVDFYTLDLSDAQGTTLIRVSGDSQAFWPHMGIIGVEGLGDQDVVETQVGEPPFSLEAALAPGEYTLYIHGGVYNHDRNVDVPATGDYSISVSAIDELQLGCLDFNNTWVTKGAEVDAALSGDDCLDTFNDPDRLFDSYAIWLDQGEGVTVTLEAEIATQLLSFNQSGFVAGTPGTVANTKHGLNVTATSSGWHRFAVYTSNDDPLAEGSYTIRFLEPIVVGDSQACTQNLPDIALAEDVQGALDADTDCFNVNRLADRYVLNISEPTLFRAGMVTDGFMPMLGLYRAGNTDLLLGNRVGINETTMLELYLTPGQYWLFAASRFPILDVAIEGNYTLTLSDSLPIDQIQTGGCAVGDTRLVLGGPLTLAGQVGAEDCFDSSQFGDQDGNPERDSYQLVLPAGSVPLVVTLSAEFDARLAIWRNGQFIQALTVNTGSSTSITISDSGNYQINVLGQQGPGAGTPDRGDYTLQLADFSETPPSAPTPTPTPTPVEVTEQLDNLNQDLDAIESITIEDGVPVSNDVVNQVGSALEKTNALAQQVTQSLPEGTAGVDVALSALNTMSRTLSASANVSSKGGAVSNTAATSSINNVATVLTSLATRTADITPTQRATVQTLASSTVTNSSNLIRAGASNDDLVSMVAATSAVLNAASAAGGELTTALVSQAEALVTKAVKTGMSSFAPGIDVEDPAQVENLLRTNPEALDFAIEASIAVKSRITPDTGAVEQELASRGIASAASESFTNVLSAVSNPDGINVGGASASEVLLSALVQFLTGGAQTLITEDGRQVLALTAGNIDLTIDPLTGTVMIKAPGEAYSAAIVNTRIVSASVPNGLSFMRDGRALIVSNGVAMELAPIAIDLIGFTSAVEQAGFSLSLRDRGLLEISLSNTQRFAGVFAFDNVVNATGSCGATTIIEPSGDINSPSYAFGVACANGVQQRIVPFVHDPVFFRSVAGYGLTMTTDRNTGIIKIPGIGIYKPGFFVSTLTSSDSAFWQANKDVRGVAFGFEDLNADGLQDVMFYTAAGAQPLYQVSP